MTATSPTAKRASTVDARAVLTAWRDRLTTQALWLDGQAAERRNAYALAQARLKAARADHQVVSDDYTALTRRESHPSRVQPVRDSLRQARRTLEDLTTETEVARTALAQSEALLRAALDHEARLAGALNGLTEADRLFAVGRGIDAQQRQEAALTPVPELLAEQIALENDLITTGAPASLFGSAARPAAAF